MPATMKELGIDQWTIEERFALAHEILDSISSEGERDGVSESQRIELERRLADSIARPDAVKPWEEIKARARAKT
jgi:putative addiction module component (TIGR02574 family)